MLALLRGTALINGKFPFSCMRSLASIATWYKMFDSFPYSLDGFKRQSLQFHSKRSSFFPSASGRWSAFRVRLEIRKLSISVIIRSASPLVIFSFRKKFVQFKNRFRHWPLFQVQCYGGKQSTKGQQVRKLVSTCFLSKHRADWVWQRPDESWQTFILRH